MAASVKGTAHLFGIGGTIISNATITAFNPTEQFNLNEETHDDGLTVETRRDDRLKEASVTLRFQSGATLPDIGDVVTVASMEGPLASWNGNYEVTQRGASATQRTHIEIELNLSQYEGITYS